MFELAISLFLALIKGALAIALPLVVGFAALATAVSLWLMRVMWRLAKRVYRHSPNRKVPTVTPKSVAQQYDERLADIGRNQQNLPGPVRYESKNIFDMQRDAQAQYEAKQARMRWLDECMAKHKREEHEWAQHTRHDPNYLPARTSAVFPVVTQPVQRETFEGIHARLPDGTTFARGIWTRWYR